jgi:hypothetical protein
MTQKISRRAAITALPIAAGASLATLPAIAEPIVTHEQLAAQDFEPHILSDNFNEKNEEALCDFATASRLAVGVLNKTKAELIEVVNKLDADQPLEEDSAERLLEGFMHGRERGETLLELLKAAEIRLAIALANVRPE